MNGDHSHSPRPLEVLIVGAGIGGLSAATALRQQGHHVRIFEQSKLAQETGAAIHLAPNANGLFRRMGLDVDAIGGVECVGVVEYLPRNGALKYHIDTAKMAAMWQHPWHLVHRAHLHTALKDMATKSEGKGRPAELAVASSVRSVDPEKATVTLEDGTVFQGDVVIGADGVHSKTRKAIPGGDKKPFDSGKSAFRFLIPTELMNADPETSVAVEKPGHLIMWIDEDRRLIMYPCVNGTMLNFVAIHPSRESEDDITGEGWQETGSKARLLDIYKNFAPSVHAILNKADDSKLKVWKLLDMEKMPSFINDKLAIMGDAAHPFLPHQGQGGGQAIEDGVALAALLPLGTLPEEIPERLKLYEKCRYERAHKIQGFTRTAGQDAAELAAKGMKLDMMEYMAYNFGHDAWDYTKNELRKSQKERDPTLRYRSPLSFGPAPGPRQPLGLHPSHSTIQRLRKLKAESSKTYSIRIRSSRTYLQTFLPDGFAFTSPATAASASIICTTLDGMTWLGGGGYSHLGLYLHGVNYTASDGKRTFGTYLAVLFENLADPIITGRSELGMPKVFADIDVKEEAGGKGCSILLSWRGTHFGKLSITGLEKESAQPPIDNAVPPPQRGPGPPPPPPEQGLIYLRSVPAVGDGSQTDAEYAVLVPKPDTAASDPAPEAFATKTASVTFEAGDWQSLPTLHHVAEALAEVPVYAVQEAKFTSSTGVDDVSRARRI